MKQKLLLTLMAFAFFAYGHAQKNARKNTAFAITAKEKGSSNWQEVRLVDITTGEEVESIYQSGDEIPLLNARTGKEIKKTEIKDVSLRQRHQELTAVGKPREIVIVQTDKKDLNSAKPVIKDDVIVITINDKDGSTTIKEKREFKNVVIYKRAMGTSMNTINSDRPFATNSAACAYDAKHDRLYYTPMGINQLRYVDMKGKNTKIMYFEDEPFGVVTGRHDVRNHITRMVIGADGDGYALNNAADHLIRFTVGRKADKTEITDLGSLTDDAANGSYSVHSGNGYGGDMIAGKDGSLYLITANRNVFQINVKTMVATFKGTIKGLPRGYTTNAAIVDDEGKVVVASANSTLGYFSFSIDDLNAEKLTTSDRVFNASDLANGNLIPKKKKTKEDKPVEIITTEQQPDVLSKRSPLLESAVLEEYAVSVYPNPVRSGNVKINFGEYPAGKYEIQLLDVSGQKVTAKSVSINAKSQVVDFALPKLIAKGTYLVKIVGDSDKVLTVEQLVVQ